ncbi:MAG: hypothetical protein K2X47_16595 [Bdellovibrionales bacterium]|nr:hypothetical protein [Bdellovibrionales bacterium]
MNCRQVSKFVLRSLAAVVFSVFSACAPAPNQDTGATPGNNSDQGGGGLPATTTTFVSTTTSTTSTTQPIVATIFKSVGHKIVHFGSYKDDFGAVIKEQGAEVPIHASIWYPTEAAGAQYTYKLSADAMTVVVSSDVLLDAPIAKGYFPLLLYSHGASGCGGNGIFMTEELARRGYIVIAPDYNDADCSEAASILKAAPMRISAVCPGANAGSCFPGIDPGLSVSGAGVTTYQSWRYRYFESKDVLDWILSSASGFRESIQKNSRNEFVVAGMGHSLGGYTIQNMVGAWPSWYDRRIQAALLLSPWVMDKLPSRLDSRTGQKEMVGNPKNWLADPMNTLGSKNLLSDYIDVPVFYQGGDSDPTITPWVCALGDGVCSWGNGQGYPTNIYPDGGMAYLTNGNSPTKKDTFFALFAGGQGGVNHFDWSNAQCNSYATIQACLADSATARNINFFNLRFLEVYAKGLTISDLLSNYGISESEMPIYYYKKQGDTKATSLR